MKHVILLATPLPVMLQQLSAVKGKTPVVTALFWAWPEVQLQILTLQSSADVIFQRGYTVVIIVHVGAPTPPTTYEISLDNC